MNKQEIRAEVMNRGYHYVDTARIDLWIEQTYKWLCSLQPWPFLQTSVTGTAPLSIPDLNQIIYVAGPNGALDGNDIRNILDQDHTLAKAGPSTDWYLVGNELRIWPVNTDSITVHYTRSPPPLTDTDQPLIPEAYHELIVDGAVLRGLKDNDEYDAAAGLQNILDLGVQGMVDAVLQRNFQNPTSIVQTGYLEDYSA